jgi:glutathione S-transferase
MLKLYHAPRTRAFRALWMLEEIQAPYELVPVDLREGGQGTPEYRAVNPMLKVPALEDGEAVVAESGAILLYLADRFPQARLAPGLEDQKRGRFLQWMFFAPGCMEPAFAEKYGGWTPNPTAYAWGDFERTIAALEAGLQAGPWLLGEQFSAADLMVGGMVHWGVQFGLMENRPPFSGYLERLAARPAFERATSIDAREAQR